MGQPGGAGAGKLSRREALRLMATGSVAVVITACAPAMPEPESALPELAGAAGPAPATAMPTPSDVPAPVPATTEAAPQAAPAPRDFGIDSELALTPNEDFYHVSYHPGDPEVDPETWQLRVDGLVDQPLALTLDEIRALPALVEMRTLECISNPVGGNLIGNAVWKGVACAEVVRLAGVQPRAREVRLEGADGYHTSIPVALAMHSRSLLVYEMNGERLPARHGFPLRCLWPGRFGQKQPKWLTRMELIAEEHLGHWESQGWSNAALIQPNSQIRVPAGDVALPPEPHIIAGLAFSDDAGVAEVEVSTDDGQTWHAAELAQAPAPFGPYVWTEWSYRWQWPEPGRHTLIARVTSGAGAAQQRSRRQSLLGGTFPDGTSNMHQVRVTVRRS